MKGEVQIVMEDGTIFRGVVNVVADRTDGVSASPPTDGASSGLSGENALLDFSLPLRPFMNKYSTGMSGSKKFALLVAHFAKGELDVPVERASVADAWSKMTGLLNGKFNPAHENRAKDSGWVYVPAFGKVALLRNWKEIFS